MARMPIGVDDFKELHTHYFFVDKTRFLQELLDQRSKVTLITRPRRFGKTLNMSMLYYFFTNQNADENRALFCGTQIEASGAPYMDEQGQYPTVFLSLKNVQSLEFELTMGLLASTMQDLYDQHRYLLESSALSDEDRAIFSRVLKDNASERDLQLSLKHLTKCLCKHHRQPAILLLDEYDVMIQSAWEHGYYDKAIAFMRNFLGTVLKTNPFLEFAVLTGVLRIAKESIFSALNNRSVSSVVSGSYQGIFGFTPEEVADIAETLGVPEKLAEIRRWYDGYDFSGQEIYNPWSVINYFQRGCTPAPYWANTSGNSILKVMLHEVDEQRRDELTGLMEGKPVMASLRDGMIYDDIDQNRDALYTMLLTTGYLKCIERKRIRNAEWGKLVIPNLEIRSVFDGEILQNMAGRLGESTLILMMEAMVNGQSASFDSYLQKILRESVSIHDTAHPETFYHGMMLGFSVLLSESYDVESNRESGYGRFDLALLPKTAGHPGILMEFKRAMEESDLEAKAKEALQQIDEKEYVTQLAKRSVQTIWRYGIAFCGKRLKLLGGQQGPL